MKSELPQMRSLKKEYAHSLRVVLGEIWRLERESLALAPTYPESLEQLVDALFDPKKKLSAIAGKVELLPNVSALSTLLISAKSSLEELRDRGLLWLIQTRRAKKVTITPEGLILLDLLASAHLRGNHYYLDADLLGQKLSKLLDMYGAKMLSQLAKVERSYREELNMAEVGLLLFFLINGSIGEEQACRNVDEETAQTVETIVRAYSGSDKRKRHELHWRGWFLTEANRKLGGVLVNREPVYYLKPDSVSVVEDAIVSRVTKDSASFTSFLEGWRRLNEVYLTSRPVLEKHGIAHFSRSRADSIYYRIENAAKLKRL